MRGGERWIARGLASLGLVSVVTTAGIVLVMVTEAARFFQEVSPWEFLTGTRWSPLIEPRAFGVLPLVSGTLLVAGIAAAVAVPLGLASAIYLSEYAHEGVRRVLKPVLEVLAGIPSIVYGYFALDFITGEVLRRLLPGVETFNALSAGIAVGVMILPMVSSLSEDAMRAVPRALRDGAYALGATRMEVALGVVVPAAASGIAASFVLALSRAIGETMVVAIAAGAMPRLTLDPRQGVQTLTGYIVQVAMGDIAHGGVEYGSVFAVGLVLFAFTLAMNLLAHYVARRLREAHG